MIQLIKINGQKNFKTHQANVLLAVDYLNEICSKEVYSSILVKLFENSKFNSEQNLKRVLIQAEFVAKMTIFRTIEPSSQGGVATQINEDTDERRDSDGFDVIVDTTDAKSHTKKNKSSKILSALGPLMARAKSIGTDRIDEVRKVQLQFPEIRLIRDDTIDEQSERNDVLMIERLVTAYNNVYSNEKQKSYGLLQRQRSNSDILPDSPRYQSEAGTMQSGMEAILLEAIKYKLLNSSKDA